ncbi:MAG: hypothetical protein PUB22_01695 [Clostridiales bacterium]|nr:hypothetical protein [Clostridiales bacterium]
MKKIGEKIGKNVLCVFTFEMKEYIIYIQGILFAFGKDAHSGEKQFFAAA